MTWGDKCKFLEIKYWISNVYFVSKNFVGLDEFYFTIAFSIDHMKACDHMPIL